VSQERAARGDVSDQASAFHPCTCRHTARALGQRHPHNERRASPTLPDRDRLRLPVLASGSGPQPVDLAPATSIRRLLDQTYLVGEPTLKPVRTLFLISTLRMGFSGPGDGLFNGQGAKVREKDRAASQDRDGLGAIGAIGANGRETGRWHSGQ